MKTILNHPWTLRLAAWLAGGVFVVAGALKLKDPLAFADSIATFELIPAAFLHFIALGLPPLEIMAGLLVITGWKRREGAFALLILTAIFSIALMQAMVRGLEVDCGCFGSGEPALWKNWASLIRNGALLGVLAWIYVKQCILTHHKPHSGKDTKSTLGA